MARRTVSRTPSCIPGGEILLGTPTSYALDVAGEGLRVVPGAIRQGGGVVDVVAGQRPQDQGAVSNVPGDGANLVQGGA